MRTGREVSSADRLPARRSSLTRKCWLLISSAVLVTMLSGLAAFAAEAPPSESQTVAATEFFEKKIRPVLVERCYGCHSEAAGAVQGGLRLDSREGLRSGGDSGAGVVPGEPDKSLLLSAIRYDGFEMPPDGRLSDQVIADFEAWIRSGAADPRDAPPAANPTGQTSPPPAAIDLAAAREFWSFQPPQRHPLPTVQRIDWPQTQIDRFLLAGIEAAELEPSPPASRRELIRRVSFDLTGLPPTPEEVEAFVEDPADDAYRLLVDRLLASPHYGERMARMWLDLARYAEDQAHIVGNDRSLCYPNAYLYRDWLIQAFNADLPYDEFIKQQLAADLIEPNSDEHWPALGFLGLGPKYYGRGRLAVQADEWEDRVDVVSRGLLGLTVACARCHHHKFDPIATEDYYALAGIFASTEMFNRPLDAQHEVNERGQAKAPEEAMHIVREGKLQNLPVYIRGNVENVGPEVPRRFLQVLADEPGAVFSDGSGRRQLAEAIATPQNPLTARVIVNRVWAMNFGRPLVATPSNFGMLGAAPTHPQLLDDLAVRFIDSGWSLKWLQRELVLSAAYQQSSRATVGQMRVDTENRWLSRMNRRRLSIEAYRDAVLAAAGQLDQTLGGSSINPADPEVSRRTLYSEISRLELNSMLAMFDYPDPNLHSDSRVQTTTPLQKLFVLNSPFMTQQAGRLAARLLPESPVAAECEPELAAESAQDGTESQTDAARVKRAYQLVLGREPTPEELRFALEFLDSAELQPLELQQRWQQYALALLASNELLFLD